MDQAYGFRTMAFGDRVMEGCVSCGIRCVQGASMLQKKVDHWRRSHSGGAVDGVLPTLVSEAGRSGALLGEKSTRHVQPVLGGD